MFELLSLLSEFVLSSFLSLPSILTAIEFEMSEVRLLEMSGFLIFVTIVIKFLSWLHSQFLKTVGIGVLLDLDSISLSTSSLESFFSTMVSISSCMSILLNIDTWEGYEINLKTEDGWVADEEMEELPLFYYFTV